jgi:hypothetical protein
MDRLPDSFSILDREENSPGIYVTTNHSTNVPQMVAATRGNLPDEVKSPGT